MPLGRPYGLRMLRLSACLLVGLAIPSFSATFELPSGARLISPEASRIGVPSAISGLAINPTLLGPSLSVPELHLAAVGVAQAPTPLAPLPQLPVVPIAEKNTAVVSRGLERVGAALADPVGGGQKAEQTIDLLYGESSRGIADLPNAPEPLSASDEPAELTRAQSILSRGGVIADADRQFLDAAFPRLLRQGIIGRGATDQERAKIQGWFPRLAEKGDWRIMGETCEDYNCLAWSAGRSDQWIRLSEVRDFDSFYRQHGLVPLRDGESEADAEVALWGNEDGILHACRHVAGEWWESKLGDAERVLHRLRDLEVDSIRGTWGQVIKFYRKARPGELGAR